MMNSKLKILSCTLSAVIIFGTPLQLIAQTNKQKAATSPAQKKDPTEKKASAGPFHGKLGNLDKSARTISVGKRTFQINAETKIYKAGKPATLDDSVIGEEVSGYVKPTEDGKMVATKLNLGPKTEAKETKPREKKTK